MVAVECIFTSQLHNTNRLALCSLARTFLRSLIFRYAFNSQHSEPSMRLYHTENGIPNIPNSSHITFHGRHEKNVGE